MHAAVAMTQELVMVAPSLPAATSEDRRRWMAQAARIAFLVVGIAATAWILGQFGTLLVYGLPAPFIRRVPLADAA